MGYYNPIYIYGNDRFIADAVAAGVDGLIIVDLPPEEDEELCIPAQKAGLSFVRLITPTSDNQRLGHHSGLKLAALFIMYLLPALPVWLAPLPTAFQHAYQRIRKQTDFRSSPDLAFARPNRQQSSQT